MRRALEWCTIGQALGPRRSLAGEILPDRYPLLAGSLDAGSLGTDAAGMIVDTLAAIASKRDLDQLALDEQLLVENALILTTPGLNRLCKSLVAYADPQGVEAREEELRAKAGARVVKRRNGITRYILDADPESDGVLGTALDARMAPRRQDRFTDDEALDIVAEDRRTIEQRRLDAFVSIARESLKHDPGDMSGTAATVLVMIEHDALVSGVGAATIAGVDTPISAKTARRIACQARIIPVVLGGDSVPLDLGESRRFFSEAQRYAMAARDGGCIWPGCTEPPGRCEAAHVTAWDQGPGRTHGRTDLDNGALLCPFHHRRFDNDGWTLETIDGVPYLIPPPWIDPNRTPRRGGRPRLPGGAAA